MKYKKKELKQKSILFKSMLQRNSDFFGLTAF